MKLQKLIIKNLASIEEAEIDFESGPIAQESIFLICGETGSGKSTILDAICLALYNSTPRMQRSPNEKYTDANLSLSNSNEINITDVRQLMRRNTVEAWVELDFIGSNDVPYTARWYVAKAHKKVEGNIKAVEWRLLNRKTNQELNKNKEITAEIQKCIGLNFEQFCRTTLLAQGEFTRFLQSRENEKSEILEKLTGTSIYSEIGCKIYNITKEKKEAYELQHQKIAGTTLLSDDEKETMQATIKTCQQDILNNESLQKEANRKCLWIEKDSELVKTKDELQRELVNKEAFIKSDTFLETQDTIRKWDLTTEARTSLKEKEEMAEEQKLLNIKGTELNQKYNDLSEGILFQHQQIQKMKDEKESIQLFLESQKSLVTMFEQSQTIITNLKGILSNQTRKEQLSNNLKKLEKNLPEKELDYKTNILLLKKEEDKGNRIQQDIEEKNKTIQSRNIEALQKESKVLSDKFQQLTETRHSLEMLSSYNQILKEAQKAEKETADELNKARDLQKSLQEQLNQSQKVFNDIEATYEKQKEGTEQWAQEARSRLKVGDDCPVCGHKIETLPSNEHFQSLLDPIRELLQSRKKDLDKIKTDVSTNIAYGKSTLEQWKRYVMQVNSAKDKYQTALIEAQKMCSIAGFSSIDKISIQLIDSQQQKIQTELNEYNNLLRQAQLLIRDRDELQKQKDRQQNLIDKSKDQLLLQEKSLSDLKNQIQTQKELIENENKTINRSIEIAREQILWENWETEWNDSPLNFINKVMRETDKYKEKQKRLENLTNQLNREQEIVKEALALQTQSLAEFPEWKQEPNSGRKVYNLNQEWSSLFAEAKALRQAIVQTEQQILKSSLALEEFLSQHPEVNMEELSTLASLSKDQIEQYRLQHQETLNQITSLKGKLELAVQNFNKHLASKPTLEETDNLETLKKQNETFADNIKNLNQQIGQLQMKLSDNEKNEKALNKEKAHEKELKDVYMKWDRLRFYFGDATGNTFRNIAQSFVLKELLHGANYYLNRLTDRYELECQAGSLTILLRDYYQGGSTRPASTLSGGESFLVSLSLALGLSSISRESLSVDTLFIDEGFGTLSDGYLQIVMDTLEKLHQMGGKKVGIISHVEGLRERIKAQIQVQRLDNSRSRIVSLMVD